MSEKSKTNVDYGLKKCRPDNLDKAQVTGDNPGNYPSDNAKYSYNYESQTGNHKILIMAADGHHAPYRWNLDQNDSGTTEQPQHEHDDLKRLPPTVLQDADPKDSRLNYLAEYRLPDSRLVYEQPGDQLGLTPDDRARGSLDPSNREYIQTSKRKQ